ncbi:GNAT family N-acetyltransferase [Pontibacter sp. G13]|uniref:GNAT family N-acetyltransferase n=1 Tax=Pontibacter sp. G13 TaxID=3074898 RepID=UPI00288A6764|nr:GNAT family N-acetyltransferase [Pontibacter sp. G13]WNJ20630.1 GNAT family N-acetyltransferase [Pontibacter sp. G13]
MQIVQATLADLSVVADLFDQYRQWYRCDADLNGAEQYLRARMSQSESVIFLAKDKQGAGMGFTQLYPIFSSINMKRMWLLNDLFVAEEARKQGVGQGLLTAAQGHAQQTGAHSLMLETEVSNQPAQKLYEGMGWVRADGFYMYHFNV